MDDDQIIAELSTVMNKRDITKERKIDELASSTGLTKDVLRLELYKLQHPKPTQPKEEDLGDPTDSVLNILRDPDLFNKVVTEFNKKIVEELNAKETLFLCACGRKVKNRKTASYNLLINDESGTGKDWVVDNVLNILPDYDKVKRTRISPNSFTYWHNSKSEPDWTWDGKIFYGEDISNSILNHEVFKVMTSSGSYATVVKDQVAVDIMIQGKPVTFITMANSHPDTELLRRFTILNLTGDSKQTKAIMKRKAKESVEGITEEYDAGIIEALKYIKTISVKIPFAEVLVDKLPYENVIMRTHFDRFLDYIKASACLHQYQRQRDGDFILAEIQDYDIARKCLLATTTNSNMIPLTKKQQKLLKIIAGMGVLAQSVREIEEKVTFINQKNLYLELDKLADYGFLDKGHEERGADKNKREVFVYTAKPIGNIDIPESKDFGSLLQLLSLSSLRATTDSTKDDVLKNNKDNNDNKHNNNDNYNNSIVVCPKCKRSFTGFDPLVYTSGKIICNTCGYLGKPLES